tara:strand:+ start:253 stop:486 length:234 start_codon:yes stop_codon:yes gene_type:complete
MCWCDVDKVKIYDQEQGDVWRDRLKENSVEELKECLIRNEKNRKEFEEFKKNIIQVLDREELDMRNEFNKRTDEGEL